MGAAAARTVTSTERGSPPDRAAAPPTDRRPSAAAGTWLPAAVVAGLLVVEGVRQGGFWPADALVVAVAAVAVLAARTAADPPDRRGWAVVGGLLLLALWWLVRAAGTGSVRAFLPLGASIVGFGAAFVAVRSLGQREKGMAASAVAAIGAAGALVGFAGLIWRWFPMAMPAQGLWRLSSTLTYSDAAGLVLAMCLLVALSGRPSDDQFPAGGASARLFGPWLSSSWPGRAAVGLCAGGLLAAQSRGALVAFAVSCFLVPLRQYRRFLVPLVAGAALGVAAVLTSPSSAPVPWLAAVLVGAVAVSIVRVPTLARRNGRPRTSRAVPALVVGACLIVAAGAVLLLHHEVGLRALAPSDGDRAVEWSAAAHQFISSPLVGVGPDRLLQFHAADGTAAHFAHNEYLQVAADAGLVGLVLLLTVGVVVARAVRRVDVVTSCAVAALVCLAVGGLFDFDWHLPFVGLLGGWVAGLAARNRT